MASPDWDRLCLEPLFRRFGKPAQLFPAGSGDPIPVTVVDKRPDALTGIGDSRIQTGTAVFEVRATELPAPAKGDVLEVDGTRFVLEAPPRNEDPSHLIWTLEAVPE